MRRISSARSPEEALVHYWRAVGRDAKFGPAMAEPPSDAGLRRRIDAARRGRGSGGRAAMQTHELPLSETTDQQTVPRPKPEPVRRRKPRAVEQDADLFEVAEPEAPAAAEPIAEPERLPEPEPERREEQAAAGPYHLDPQAVLLQRADPRNLRPTDRSDSYLYHVTHGAEAKAALAGGLVVSAQDPVILTERQGVAYWLSVLAEDVDVILDGPADFVVLRLRRIAVEGLLEPDPDASRSAGCKCYMLTGGAGLTE